VIARAGSSYLAEGCWMEIRAGVKAVLRCTCGLGIRGLCLTNAGHLKQRRSSQWVGVVTMYEMYLSEKWVALRVSDEVPRQGPVLLR
jgi:hypothetical protein